MIRIEDLSIGYRDKGRLHVVAAHINASISGGELTCLLGTNGVGKSTLLRTLSAFQPKLAGSIYIQGKELEEYTGKQLSRIVSVVLTERCDVHNLSVTDLISMGRSPYTDFWGTLGKEDHAAVRRAIALTGIEPLTNRMMHTLSDDERQKVMIAKALSQETPVILLDEPTAFLDFPSKVEMMQLLHRLSRQTGKAIFLSTHDLELALQVADRIWLMKPAANVTIGTPEDLILEGCLAHFFTRKGIGFDQNTGLFRIEFACTANVRLIGEGERYVMLCRALRRNGIEAAPEAASDISIHICKSGYSICLRDKQMALAENVDQTLKALHTLLSPACEEKI